MKSSHCIALAVCTLLAAALLGAFASGPARAAVTCSKPPQPASVEVTSGALEVTFDHALSKAELAALADREYGHGHGKGGAVFGLTAGRVSAGLEVHALMEKRRDGIYCGWPARVIASVAYDGPIAVHVAREHPKGSCQHDAILRHEMEHVAVFREALGDYEKRLRRALERALAEGRFPVMGRDRAAVQAEVNRPFETAFKRAVAEAASARDQRNARLDTPENYRRTRNLCRSW